MNKNYPVVLFVYKRLTETKRTIESLIQNPEASSTDLIVFVDGAKNDFEQLEVDNVAQYVSNLTSFKSLEVIQRESNFGLANSFVNGTHEPFSSRISLWPFWSYQLMYKIHFFGKRFEL